MVESPTPRTLKPSTVKGTPSAQARVEIALQQASKQAKKHLAANGLKLPTQSWTGASIKNPAI